MFTVDASVHLNALNLAEEGSVASRAFLERLHRRPWPVQSPALLLVEIAGAVARAADDPERGIALSAAIRTLPGHQLVALDPDLAGEAAAIAAERRLRGADAVYASVARRHRTILVTRDRQQLERLPPVVPTVTPEEALARIETLETDPLRRSTDS